MSVCKVPVILAYMMTVYTLASLYYIIVAGSIGTPFKDSLTSDQNKIKADSARVRSLIFSRGVVISAVIVILLRPYELCAR